MGRRHLVHARLAERPRRCRPRWPAPAPCTVNAASAASGSSGDSGAIGPSRSASASGDGPAVARRPDAGAVDAAPAAVDEHAIDHQVQVLLPVVRLVVAEQDLAEAGPVHLHGRVAGVLRDRGRAAEDQAARAVVEHRGTHIAEARVEGDGLARHPRLEERLRHPPRRPRLLRPGFEHQADLQRNDRQPQTVHPRRVRTAAPFPAPTWSPGSCASRRPLPRSRARGFRGRGGA